MYEKRFSPQSRNQTWIHFKRKKLNQYILSMLIVVVVAVAKFDFDLWLQFFYWDFDPVTLFPSFILVLMAVNHKYGQFSDAFDSNRPRNSDKHPKYEQENETTPNMKTSRKNIGSSKRKKEVPILSKQDNESEEDVNVINTSYADSLEDDEEEDEDDDLIFNTTLPSPAGQTGLGKEKPQRTSIPGPDSPSPEDNNDPKPPPVPPKQALGRHFGTPAKKNYNTNTALQKQLPDSKSVRKNQKTAHLKNNESMTFQFPTSVTEHNKNNQPSNEKPENEKNDSVEAHGPNSNFQHDQHQHGQPQYQKNLRIHPETNPQQPFVVKTKITNPTATQRKTSKSQFSRPIRPRHRNNPNNSLKKELFIPDESITTNPNLNSVDLTDPDFTPPTDPFINRIQKYHLPIVWIIGESTLHIKQIVRNYCEQLADTLDFKYIHIDEKIGEWYEREVLSAPSKFWENLYQQEKRSQHGPGNEAEQKTGSYRSTNAKKTGAQQLAVLPPIRGCQIKAKAFISESLTKQSMVYDKKLRHFLRQGQALVRPKFENSQLLNNLRKLGEIAVDTREPLKREKMMEILKYAMIESLNSMNSTRGFIIDGSFTDRIDFIKFKQTFYIPTVGLYFTESVINHEMEKYKTTSRALPFSRSINEQRRNSTLKSAMEDTERSIRGKVIMNKPRNFRRTKQYSFIDVDLLCEEFKNNIVRIVNAEHLNPSTIKYINSLVRSHLRHNSQDHNQEKEKSMSQLGVDEDAADISDPETDVDAKVGHETLKNRDKKSRSPTSVHHAKATLPIDANLKSSSQSTGNKAVPPIPASGSSHSRKQTVAPTEKSKPPKITENYQLIQRLQKPSSSLMGSVSESANKTPKPTQRSPSPNRDRDSHSPQELNSQSLQHVKTFSEKVDGPNMFDIHKGDLKIDLEFNKIRFRNLPIIWIYGYKQTAIASQCQNCCVFLAKYFNFAFLQMDEQIVKWHRYSLKKYWPSSSGVDPQSNFSTAHELIFHRAKRIIKKVIPASSNNAQNKVKHNNAGGVDSGPFLSQTECFTLIKYAMIHSMPTNGFIIDNFPLDSHEATEFEKYIYPAALGLCFSTSDSTNGASVTSRSYSNSKRFDKPKFFLRNGTIYSEHLLDKLCSDFMNKTIKILNVHDLHAKGVWEICELVQKHLKAFASRAELSTSALQEKTESGTGGQRFSKKARGRIVNSRNDGKTDKSQSSKQNPSKNLSKTPSKTPSLSPKHKKKHFKDSWTQPEVIIMKHTSLPNDLGQNNHTALQSADLSGGHHKRAVRRQQEFKEKIYKKGAPVPSRSPSPSPRGKGSFKGKLSPNTVFKVDGKTPADKKIDKDHINHNVHPNIVHPSSVVKLWEGKNTGDESAASMSEVNLVMDFDNPSYYYTGYDSQDGENMVAGHSPKIRVSEPKHAGRRPSPILEEIARGRMNRVVRSNNVQYERFSSQGPGPGHFHGLEEAQIYIDNVKGNYAKQIAGENHDHRGHNHNAVLPDISLPSTLYETANSSDDEFDEDDDESEISLSKTSTIQGLLFGADGHRSRNGIITPNAELLAITISQKNSEIPLNQNTDSYDSSDDSVAIKENGRLGVRRHKQNENNKTAPSSSDKNRSTFGKIVAGFFGVFRKRSKNRT